MIRFKILTILLLSCSEIIPIQLTMFELFRFETHTMTRGCRSKCTSRFKLRSTTLSTVEMTSYADVTKILINSGNSQSLTELTKVVYNGFLLTKKNDLAINVQKNTLVQFFMSNQPETFLIFGNNKK